ncbi:helix-turn-helix domain-containing protein [Myroides odoratus]|uniref:Helix-turn-helix domain-containing protein n=1 Tax=Myroides odoratus TaxID=256 RepID=A0A9Q7EBM8_MYROD|nr:helix-turn-helix domain-containing protein [Myroides odoratus]EHQ44253.1 hypothetical protein Myrod_3449 [Myroides odoratus DSM 2801]EKB05852.1 hypothetical protein HMPREF9716_02645 [Myroides odoratus CIP 103059]QQU01534.1 helix-turn-helix domain-containing protein [Myroides odoratus]WQD56196.1 helix-turn-helix domain-containing protein [Myroides odoratus]STZ31590.1 Bacteriophage CI repressor helix-turn-helix domain [Myroides odoratus]
MDDKNIIISSTENVIEKIKISLGLDRDKELAILLNVKFNTLSSWKIRQSIPYKKIFEICSKYDLDLNDIIYDNYSDVKNELIRVPILFLDNYWSYFYDLKFNKTSLQYFLLPREVADIDIIIQLTKRSSVSKFSSELMYVLCKKVNLKDLIITKSYVFTIKSMGIFDCILVSMNFENQKYKLKLQDNTYVEVSFEKVIEIYSYKGKYYKL